MNRLASTAILVAFVSLASTMRISAQQRIEVPLTVTNGSGGRTLYFGFFSDAHYCFHQADTCECIELPPIPPAGVFDARLTLPRAASGDSCCASGGSQCDFRPLTSATQKDTFKIKLQSGEAMMRFSWPAGLATYFTQLTLRYFDGSGNVNIDMLTDTSVIVTEAGSIATIYSGGLRLTSVEEMGLGIPRGVVLSQNFPNPFNPSTSISFAMSHSSFTILKVYDVLGREVATLAEGERAAGEHRVEWNPVGVASGIYTYRLTSPGAILTGKMVLLR